MRDLRTLDRFRDLNAQAKAYGLPLRPEEESVVGMFRFPSPTDRESMFAVVSGIMGWDHVSISRPRRTPNWPEMCYVKDLFFYEEECVMQLHPPKSEWINNHPYCLHLWKPHNVAIPKPPSHFVGVKGFEASKG